MWHIQLGKKLKKFGNHWCKGSKCEHIGDSLASLYQVLASPLYRCIFTLFFFQAAIPQMMPPTSSPLTTALNAPLVTPPTLAPLAALLTPEVSHSSYIVLAFLKSASFKTKNISLLPSVVSQQWYLLLQLLSNNTSKNWFVYWLDPEISRAVLWWLL